MDHKNHMNNMNFSNSWANEFEMFEPGVEVYRDFDESDLNYSKISNNSDKPNNS